MKLSLIFAGIVAFLISGCSNENEIFRIQKTEDIHFFYYQLEGEKEELTSDRINTGSVSDLPTVLDSINLRLSEYFSRETGSVRGNVKFKRESLSTIETRNKSYIIAVVNIDDKSGILEKKYFQGSTGGMITQNTIMLNLLQPQLTGYIDGVIILLNDEPIQEMDHLDLRGIKVPGNLEYLARQGIK